MSNIAESDRKRRVYFTEQKERLDNYMSILKSQELRIEVKKSLTESADWKEDEQELNEYLVRLPGHFETYELLLEQEIDIITIRASRLGIYDAQSAKGDLDFLEKFADVSDEYTAQQLRKYYTKLLGHPDQNIKNRAQSLLGLQ